MAGANRGTHNARREGLLDQESDLLSDGATSERSQGTLPLFAGDPLLDDRPRIGNEKAFAGISDHAAKLGHRH